MGKKLKRPDDNMEMVVIDRLFNLKSGTKFKLVKNLAEILKKSNPDLEVSEMDVQYTLLEMEAFVKYAKIAPDPNKPNDVGEDAVMVFEKIDGAYAICRINGEIVYVHVYTPVVVQQDFK